MSSDVVQWVLVIRYGLSAHRATYGRLQGSKYTKDYIQLSRKPDFIGDLKVAFPEFAGGQSSVAIDYRWPGGSAQGKIFEKSADRPHLTWDTNSAPAPWTMLGHPTPSTVETVRGNPSLASGNEADEEYHQLKSSGFGQPFLIAVKLRDEPGVLHLRVMVDNPEEGFGWADLETAPAEIQELAALTSDHRALAWRLFTGEESTELRFDSSEKIGPWNVAGVSAANDHNASKSSETDGLSATSNVDNDELAEALPYSEEEISELQASLESKNYNVPDSFATTKTRGSAQRVFAAEVKKNYGWKCALTGIADSQFLIASHIVPWSVDEGIRLDPKNGICLSILVDRAFEIGLLIISDDCTVTFNWGKVHDDPELKAQLEQYEGQKLELPKAHSPSSDYLKRRREL